MKRFFLLFSFSLQFVTFLGQNVTSLSKKDSLLNEILLLQNIKTGFYSPGIFPCQRGKHKLKEDNNVFFSSLITFTLQNIKVEFSNHSKKNIDTVCKKVIRNYPLYKNKTGLGTYNFWHTNPPEYFPNSKYLSGHKNYNVPDDADCTSIIYLTDTSLHSNVTWLKDKFSKHANLTTTKIKSTFRKYRNYKAYSTWFGKKMPIEFDICVQSNVLYFVFENKLQLNINDSATISLIKSMVMSGEYLKQSAFVSPSYKKRSVILYHLARLLGKFNIPELECCREKIKKDIENELLKTKDFMENILLSSASLKLGGNPKPVVYPIKIDKELNSFVFFNADLFSAYARPSLKFISKSKLFTIPFHCKAYNMALLLEYEVLKNKN